MNKIAARIADALDGEDVVKTADWAREEGGLSLGEALEIGRLVEPVVVAYMREALTEAVKMLNSRFDRDIPDGFASGWLSAADQISEDIEMLVWQAKAQLPEES